MTQAGKWQQGAFLASSIPEDAASLESILCTEELDRRPLRVPDYAKENAALAALASALAESRHTILETLAETILHATDSDSSGLSLLTSDGTTPDAEGHLFYWPAIAGMWKHYVGGGTPRDFGPCGDVLDRNSILLLRHAERRYPYLLPVSPAAEECLLVPFYVRGKAVGTIWAIMHSDRRKFDSEDRRLMGVLGKFASLAYQTLGTIDDLKSQMDACETAETRLRDLIMMIGHEIRNPLSGILATTDLLLDARLSPEDRDCVRSIQSAAESLVRITDDVLVRARMDSGSLTIASAEFDLPDLVASVTRMIEPLARNKGLELTAEYDPGMPRRVLGDSGRIREVIVNLVSNAVKFTTHGRIVIRADCEAQDAREARIRLAVTDSGSGISQEKIAEIFERTPAFHSEGGHGIGLVISRQLIDLMGGRLEVQSQVSRGSTFRVSLPMGIPDHANNCCARTDKN